MSGTASATDDMTAHARVAELEAALAAERELRTQWEQKHDLLLGAYQALEQQLELTRRRLYIAKAERIDTTQLEIEFASTLAALDKLAGTLPSLDGSGASSGGSATGPRTTRTKPTPTGRRDLYAEDVPEERIVLDDPTADGKVERIGIEQAARMM